MASFTKMSRAEWEKFKAGTGDLRTDILKEAIQAGSPVSDINGNDLFIKNSTENLRAIDDFVKNSGQSTFDVTLTDGKVIKSSTIGKSPLFGGKGAGAGATGATADAESLQCIYLAAMLGEGTDKPYSHFSKATLKSYVSKVQTDVPFERYIKAPDAWHESGYVTAKHLIDKGFVKKDHILHRGSPTMDAIYNAKTKALRAEGKPPMQNDKWNPGDIWAVKQSLSITNTLDDTSIDKLNQTILKAYQNRSIVGISLKQISSLRFNAKHSEYNITEKEIPIYRFSSVLMRSPSGTFWSSKYGLIYFGNKKADIRAPNLFSALNFEVQGQGARGGRVGYTQIAYSAKQHLNFTLPENSTLKTDARLMTGTNPSKRKIDEFWKMVSFVDSSLDRSTWESGLKESTADKIHAKLGIAYICYAIMKAPAQNRNAFVTETMNVALAQTNDSSAYVKVEKA